MSIFKLALDFYSAVCTTVLQKKDIITPMCDPKTTRAYCCEKSNWIEGPLGYGITGLERIA